MYEQCLQKRTTSPRLFRQINHSILALVQVGGVVWLNSGTFVATSSSFVRNSVLANSDVDVGLERPGGGVVYLRDGCKFLVTNSSFIRNTANSGGVAQFEGGSSQFLARNSSFVENRAWQGNFSGDVASTTQGSTFELYNSRMLRHDNVVRCDSTGTIYAALLDMNQTEGLFTLGGACIIFFYQSNNDGSEEYGRALVERKVISGGILNLVQWRAFQR